jgi:sugar/nucleoside kinase (ribokinase family)
MAVSNYVFVSKDYLREKLALQSAEQFFQRVLAGDWEEDWSANVKALICPWGAEGVYYLDMSSRSTHHIVAQRLDRIVESVGAGDTFIGATIAALSTEDSKCSLECAVRAACHVASAKCTQQGFKLPLKSLMEWRAALCHNSTAA